MFSLKEISKVSSIFCSYLPSHNISTQNCILSLDQGTTSTRAVLFDDKLKVLDFEQIDHNLITPHPKWVEIDANEIIENSRKCLKNVIKRIPNSTINKMCIGITNQRETTIAWNKLTGKPYGNAIVWLDSRTQQITKRLSDKNGGENAFLEETGLKIANYFSAVKMNWLIENNTQIQNDLSKNKCLFGTVDSWIIFNLTKGLFYTDITNASRTLLMDIRTGKWSEHLCNKLHIPLNSLPEIKDSSDFFGNCQDEELKGIPITGVIGDQQASCLGHLLDIGQAKCTYGTGCFILLNTGPEIKYSKYGLLTTPLYKKKDYINYALEGSIEVGGNSIKWAKNSMGLFSNYEELNNALQEPTQNENLIFVPCFNGLYSPYWEPKISGAMFGIVQSTNKKDILKALVNGIIQRVREGVSTFEKDFGNSITKLSVDGGVSENNLIMQMQSDILNIILERKEIKELTAVGSAIAAGLSDEIGLWKSLSELKGIIQLNRQFVPTLNEKERQISIEKWKKAIDLTFQWI